MSTVPSGASEQERNSERLILFVDDEPDVLKAYKNLLERRLLGVRVVTAKSGPEALKLLERHKFHLIISDYRMPAMDGLEFLAEARRRDEKPPRILFTAYAQTELATKAMEEGIANVFLSKDLPPERFVDIIRSHLVATHSSTSERTH